MTIGFLGLILLMPLISMASFTPVPSVSSEQFSNRVQKCITAVCGHQTIDYFSLAADRSIAAPQDQQKPLYIQF